MSRERLEALRKKKRLAELRAKQGEQPTINTPVVEEKEKDLDVSQADAILRGAGQGATLELLDEGIAAYKTGKEVVGEIAGGFMEQGLKGAVDAAPNIAETYRKHKEDETAHLQRLQEKHPYSYMGANAAGVVANAAATMGVSSYLYGAKVATSVKAGMGIFGGAGFIHGVGSSESDKLEDVLKEGQEGFMAGAAGEVLAPGAKAIKGTQVSSFLKYLGVKKHVAENALQRFGKQIPDWVDRVMNYTDEAGEFVFSPTKTRARVLDDVIAEEAVAGAEMGSILNKIDTDFNLKIDHQGMYADVKNFVLDPLYETTIDPEIVRNIDQADSFLKATIFKNPNIDAKTQLVSGAIEGNPNLNLTNLHRFKTGIYAKAKTVKKSGDPKIVNKALVQEMIADRVGVYIDDMIAASSKLTKKAVDTKGKPIPSIAETYANAKVKFGDLRETRKLLNNSLTQDKGANILAGTFNDKLFTAAALLQTTGSGLAVRKAGITAMGLKAVANHPGVNGVIAASANRISNAIASNPEAFEGIARSLASSAAISGEAFMEDLMSAAAKVNLTLEPLARSTQEVMRRKDDILTMLHSKDPKLATQLGLAIQKQNVNAIRQFMSTHGSGKMIQPGIGWDGMAVTEQDKMAVRNFLQSVSSPRKRMMLTTQFGRDSMIPQEMFKPQKPEPMNQFIYRKKRNKIENPEY